MTLSAAFYHKGIGEVLKPTLPLPTANERSDILD
jgi:hypothetical protein